MAVDEQENEKADQELTRLLEAAADDRQGAVEAFFERLLRSSVYVPLTAPVIPEQIGDRPLPMEELQGGLAGDGQGKHNFATVDYDGKECIPIFSERPFVLDWADKELPCAYKPFKTILWLLGGETSLYLNPSQQVGKELTAWEIDLLKQGPDAIPELAAAVRDEPLSELEVRADADMYPEFKKKLLPILELYEELEQAFLVAVKEGGTDSEKPMIGLRWSGGNKGKREYVRSELENAAAEHRPGGIDSIFVADDLDQPRSPNLSIFEGVTPFFFRKPYLKAEQSGGFRGLISQLFKREK